MIADGKMIAEMLEQSLAERLRSLPKKEVCFIAFGADAASRQFIRMKLRIAERLGVAATVLEYPENISQNEALATVRAAAAKNYAGIVVQLPLPPQLLREGILNSVPPDMDIDMLGEDSKRRYANKETEKVPPVARTIWEILKFYNVELDNKNILIVGNGKLVGEPVSMMFSRMNIPHRIMDENTDREDSKAAFKKADIIISGAGSPRLISPDMIQDGVVLIDAGTSEQNGKLVGDIDPACASKAALYTPVPGGVGPVTVISLFLNL